MGRIHSDEISFHVFICVTGVPRDVPTAIECFTAAAASPQEQSGSAAYWLGHLYRIGDPEGGARLRLNVVISTLRTIS